MKKVALAGFLLVLVALGVAYNRMHDSASSSVGAAGATGISWAGRPMVGCSVSARSTRG
jgi:hypothetical protein